MADKAEAPPAAESGEEAGQEESTEREGEGKGRKKQEEPVYTQRKLEELIEDRLKRERRRLEAEISSDVERRLLSDDEFRQTALKQWEVLPDQKEAARLDDQKVKELHQAWEQDHLKPLKDRAAELEAEVSRSREDGLESALLSAGSSRLQKAVTKRVGGEDGRTPLFQMLRPNFVYDNEAKAWRVRGKDGDYAPSPTGEKLYMTVDEFLDRWARDPDNAAFVRDTTQGGSGYEGPGNKGGKRQYTRSEYTRLVNDEEYYAKHRHELLAAVEENRVR